MPPTTKSPTGSTLGSPGSAAPRGAGVQLVELKDLVVGYARQETVDPLRTLGRYLGFGIAGSLMIGSGFCLLLLALLRGLQEIDLFNEPGELSGGTFSWVPYVITALAGLVVTALFIRQLITAMKKREDR